jgi:hypothetical protein
MMSDKEFLKQQKRLLKSVPELTRIVQQEVIVLPGAFFFKHSLLIVRVNPMADNIIEDVLNSFAMGMAFYADDCFEEHELLQKVINSIPSGLLPDDFIRLTDVFPLGFFVPFLEEQGIEDPR